LGTGAAIKHDFAVNIGGGGLAVSADASLFATERTTLSGHQSYGSKLQVYGENTAYIQVGTSADDYNRDFTAFRGFFFGVTSGTDGQNAEINRFAQKGGTIDFRVGTTKNGSTLAARIEASGKVNLGDGGLLIRGQGGATGASGDILVATDEGEAMWTQTPVASLWSGHAATGASFGGTVGIGTGGGFGSGVKAGIFGALLEVGGGALIHGAMTADSLYVGGVQGSGFTSALVSGLTAKNAGACFKSSAKNAFLQLDAYTNKDAYIELKENSISNRALISWIGSKNQLHMAAGGNTFAVVNTSGQVALGTGSVLDTDFNVSIWGNSDIGGLGVSADASLFSGGGRGTTSGYLSAPLQVYKQNHAYIQIGTTAGNDFSRNRGFFIGVTSGADGNNAEIGRYANKGGTVDFRVGKNKQGSTLAARIEASGKLNLSSGGLLIRSQGGGTGASGDVLVATNEGEVMWAKDNSAFNIGLTGDSIVGTAYDTDNVFPWADNSPIYCRTVIITDDVAHNASLNTDHTVLNDVDILLKHEFHKIEASDTNGNSASFGTYNTRSDNTSPDYIFSVQQRAVGGDIYNTSFETNDGNKMIIESGSVLTIWFTKS